MLKDFSQQMAALEQASTQSNTYTATFEISTWLFMQGATEKAVLREQSIKGALRFWWRALYWHEEFLKAESCNELNGDYQKIHNRALSSLHRRESQVWGGLVCKKKAIASPVKLTLVKNETKELKVDKNRVGDGLKYGMGLGVFEPQIGLTRKGLSGGNFSLELEFSNLLNINPECDPTEKPTLPQHRYTLPSLIDEVLLSVVCLSEFGGLGARSRNGFGSVNLLSLLSESKVDVLQYHREQLRSHYTKMKSTFKSENDSDLNLLPPIPAFSKYTLTTYFALDKLPRKPDSRNSSAMHELNKILNTYKGLRKEIKGSSKQDTNAPSFIKQVERLSKNKHSKNSFSEEQLPDKFYLGLPVEFHKNVSIKIMDESAEEEINRRAKQLFIHICPNKVGKADFYFPRFTLLPSSYLPLQTTVSLEYEEKRLKSVEASNKRALETNQRFFESLRVQYKSVEIGGTR